jgi:phosphomannomutase
VSADARDVDGVLDQIVKAYDIRGLVEPQLDGHVVEALGAAIADELVDPGGALIVGRDMRPSSPRLAEQLIHGVRSRGVDVIDIGLASTDQVTFASGELDAASVMITASHNPAAFNGMKLTRAGAVPVSLDTGLSAIRVRAAAILRGAPATAAARHGTLEQRDLTAAFVTHVRSFADVTGSRPARVAVDAGNGMAGHLWPKVSDGLAIDTTPLYFELDGTFPNHPANPLEAANLVDLQRVVRDRGLDLGLAFDGDADRVFAVDEQARAVSSSAIGALIAERLLAREPGATVLYNVICSHVVPETIEAAGGVAVRTRVGHSLIKAEMARTNAVFAVEHSGHFYFRDNHRADSGMIAALVLLEAVAQEGRALSAVLAPYDRYVGSGEHSLRVDDVDAVLDRVRGAFASRASMDTLDGLSVELPDGSWFNLRASNTEPLLRCNVEAADERAMVRLRDEVLALLADT